MFKQCQSKHNNNILRIRNNVLTNVKTEITILLFRKNEQVLVVVVFLNLGFCQIIVLQPGIMLSYSAILTL